MNYTQKYLKYKSKYLELKNQLGGSRRIQKEIEMYKANFTNINLDESVNPIILTFVYEEYNFKIYFPHFYPQVKPEIFRNNKKLFIDNWLPVKHFFNYLKSKEKIISEYQLLPEVDKKEYSYIELELIFDLPLVILPTKFISVNNTINLIEEIVKIVESNKLEILSIFCCGKKIDSNFDFSILRNMQIIHISVYKNMSKVDLIQYLKDHESINKISKLKPVATLKSGSEPRIILNIYKTFIEEDKKEILLEVSKFLSEKNHEEIIVDIDIDIENNTNTTNTTIFYNKKYLEKLCSLFGFDLIKGLNIIRSINPSSEELDFIYIAFGDIDFNKYKTIDDLTDNGKRIYTEYISS